MIYFRIITVYFDKLLPMLCASAHVLAVTLFASHLWLSTCSGSIVVDLHNTSDLNPFYYYVWFPPTHFVLSFGCRSTQKMRHYVYFPFLSVCPGQVSFTYIRRTTIKSWHDDEKEKNNNRCLHFFLTRSCKEGAMTTTAGLDRVINGWQ